MLQKEIKRIIDEGTHKERLRLLSRLIEFNSLGNEDLDDMLLTKINDADELAYFRQSQVAITIRLGATNILGLGYELTGHCANIRGNILRAVVDYLSGDEEEAEAKTWGINESQIWHFTNRLKIYNAQYKALKDFAEKYNFNSVWVNEKVPDYTKRIKKNIKGALRDAETNSKIDDFYKEHTWIEFKYTSAVDKKEYVRFTDFLSDVIYIPPPTKIVKLDYND